MSEPQPEPNKTFIEKLEEEKAATGVPPIASPAAVKNIRELLNVTEPGSDGYIKQLLHADSGVGKTHYLGTAGEHEETGPILILDCEGGTDTLRGWPGVD